MTNLFTELWNVALTMIEYIGLAWDWLVSELIINIPLKIPILFPNGILIDTGITPISLLGAGMIVLIIYWFVWGG